MGKMTKGIMVIQLVLIEMMEILQMVMDEIQVALKKQDGRDQEETHQLKMHALKFEEMAYDLTIKVHIVMTEIH